MSSKYTVLSVNEGDGRINSDHVEARDRLHAFAVVADKRKDEGSVFFVACLDGHLEEGKDVEYPGECTVYTETVLEQPDVFGEP